MFANSSTIIKSMAAAFSIEGILSSKKELSESVITSKSDDSAKSQNNSLTHLLSTIFPPNLPRHWIDLLRQDRYPRRVGHPYQNRTPPKRKKPRTSFNRQQIMELERRFHRQKYLASSERCDLAKDLDMTDSQVKTWFQNRRTKWRRQTSEEREAERQAASRYLLTLQNEINQSNNPSFNYTSSTLSAISNLQPWAIPQLISEMSSDLSSPVAQIDDSHSEK